MFRLLLITVLSFGLLFWFFVPSGTVSDLSIDMKRQFSTQQWAAVADRFSKHVRMTKFVIGSPLGACKCPPPADGPYRYVFVLTDVHREVHYTIALQLAITTLLRTCPKYGITVIWNCNFAMTSREAEWFSRNKIDVRYAPPIHWDGKQISLEPRPWSEAGRGAAGFFKLHAWNLTQWEKVAVIDSDYIFLRNVDDLFLSCSRMLCATREHASTKLSNDVQWNAGFFIATPQGTNFIRLLLRRWVGLTDGRLPYIREQLALNSLFPNVQILPKDSNLQFCNSPFEMGVQLTEFGLKPESVRALHVKFWKMDPASHLHWALHTAGRTNRTC